MVKNIVRLVLQYTSNRKFENAIILQSLLGADSNLFTTNAILCYGTDGMPLTSMRAEICLWQIFL